jgi:leucyl aminopeptidase
VSKKYTTYTSAFSDIHWLICYIAAPKIRKFPYAGFEYFKLSSVYVEQKLSFFAQSMPVSISYISSLSGNESAALLFTDAPAVSEFYKSQPEREFVERSLSGETAIIAVNQYVKQLFFIRPKAESVTYRRKEALRKTGADLFKQVSQQQLETLQLASFTDDPEDVLALCEGLVLSSYAFLKYKTDKEKKQHKLKHVRLYGKNLSQQKVEELNNLIEATCTARDLVNEPVIYLTAEQLSEEITGLGKKAGFEVEVLNKSKIASLKMGGLLAVNMGSPNPPTFNILAYKPSAAQNSRPYILVGKGVVYDTGGLSLKPTPNSMDLMKSDMAGAAAVAGAIYALAKNQVPVHVIGLIPATENRPDGNAITPGDVITMYSGKTVEVMNTDAEGRLILADALHFAAKYQPELVIDLATLTGSAVKAIGKEGIVYMGTADEQTKKAFEASGNEVYERLVEFPLWEEYSSQLESGIADIKNLGGPDAGAITAGKFLEHFVSYPWLHLDIAGGAFLTSPDSYRGIHGTGLGVRLLYHYLKSRIQ